MNVTPVNGNYRHRRQWRRFGCVSRICTVIYCRVPRIDLNYNTIIQDIIRMIPENHYKTEHNRRKPDAPILAYRITASKIDLLT